MPIPVKLVGSKGLEPLCFAALDPKSSVSANSTNSPNEPSLRLGSGLLHRNVVLVLHSNWCEVTGSNRRPSACKADALPTELILHFKEKPGNFLLSHIVLPSALKCLTSVFGMGTGVSTLPSSPDLFFEN